MRILIPEVFVPPGHRYLNRQAAEELSSLSVPLWQWFLKGCSAHTTVSSDAGFITLTLDCSSLDGFT